MKLKLLFLALFINCAFILSGQTSPHLVIYGTIYGTNNIPVEGILVQAFNGQGAEVASDTTGALGQYELFIENGSVIGPNQIYTVSVVDCDNQLQSQTVSNQQGTVDIAVLNFYTCISTSFCNAAFEIETSPGSNAVMLYNTSTFSEEQSETATYLWTVSGNGNTYTENSTNLDISIPGEYNVCLTITTSSGCSSQFCNYVVVNGGGTSCSAEFTYQQINANSIVLNPVQEYPPNTVSYQWQFANGETSNLVNPTYTFPELTDSVEVCLTIITPNCTNTFCLLAHIDTNPTQGMSISGEINFTPNISLSFPVSVSLYLIDQVSGAYVLVDTTSTSAPSGEYVFNGVLPGSYIVLATPGNGIVQLAPTYFGNTLNWQSATVINVENQNITNINIQLQVTNNPGGNGGVNGNVEMGPGKINSDGEFFSDISVMITLPNGNLVSWGEVGNEGEFSISNLPFGIYHIWAEKPGYTCMKTEFELSAQFPVATMTIKVTPQGALQVVLLKNEVTEFVAFPNPFSDVLNISIDAPENGIYQIQLYNSTGQLVFSETQSLSKGNQKVVLQNLVSESKGLFFITLTKDGVRLASKSIAKQ